MEASSLEKNLPDDNEGSDSTLGGCSPLSWCGFVSLAGVIAVCIGGVATHPLQAIRFVSRFIPAELGPSLSVVLCLVTIGCIVYTVPFGCRSAWWLASSSVSRSPKGPGVLEYVKVSVAVYSRKTCTRKPSTTA